MIFKKIPVFIIIFILGIGTGFGFLKNSQTTPSTVQEKNTPKAFIGEVYDKIKDNYWNNISDVELLDLFRLGIDRNGGQLSISKFENKDKLLNSIPTAVSRMDEDTRLKFLASVVSSVLASLAPNGRSGLYTQKQEETLKNTVENINPEKDLYKDLGLQKGASTAAVEEAFQKQAAGADKEKLKSLTYAKETLTQADKKEKYDQKGVEPTIFTKIVSPGILYVQFKKFSPTSLDEFVKAFDQFKDRADLTSLIFDLRGNVGGAIDSTAYFLGFFLGKNQYAFDFYHKGEYLPFKTQTDKLSSISKYKQVVTLIDNQTQSSAEMLAASLKKYHLGTLIGVPTKGWGTVERVFPLDNQITSKEKYSIFLVHSITLRDDNQPIEGRGVDPDVNIKNAGWEADLFNYFRNIQLNEAVKQVLSNQ